MTAEIGFVLLTHNKPNQIHRLIGRLNLMFGHPPIVCHHDFSQCDLSVETFSKNVLFVRPHAHTEWGDFSVAESMVRALETLYRTAKPDWCVTLSGADYPIKEAAQILSDLQKGGYDVHSECELIDPAALTSQRKREMAKRYFTRWVRVPQLVQPLLRSRFSRVRLRPMALLGMLLPFSAQLRCYAGLLWFSVNRPAAEYILQFHKTQPRLAAHYRHVLFADESYFQTILANGPFKINQENWRYMDWSAGTVHPKILRLTDLPTLLASPAHFARKFDMDVDAQILDELDAVTSTSSGLR